MTDDDLNNILAAGGIFMILHQAGLDPQVDMRDGQVTNSMTVQPGFLRSRYRVTVERVTDEADHA